MRKETLYLDTSVVSVYFDPRDPFLQRSTQEFWKKLDRYEAAISDVVLKEINQAPEEVKAKMLGHVANLSSYTVTDEAVELMEVYLKNGVFRPRSRNDALHAAVATVARVDFLVSWNFTDLVRVQTRRLVNFLNQQQGYAALEIVAPSEL